MNEVDNNMNLTCEESKEKWDDRYMEIARHVAAWSKDEAKVGAVLVSKRGGQYLGYNGFPKGVADSAERLANNAQKQEMVVHAEQNALLLAGGQAEGATIYVWGKPVCSRCAGMLIQAGVARVVAKDPESVPQDSKWRAPGILARELLRESGVEFQVYP